MLIAALKPGHDGSICAIQDGVLTFSYEAEKDSFPRFASLDAPQLLDGFAHLDAVPDIFCLSGWRKESPLRPALGQGYFGTSSACRQMQPIRIMGHDCLHFSSTHERAHVLCSYGLSPFADLSDAYALVWEGVLGHFYHIRRTDAAITPIGQVLSEPGNKYSFLYALADPTVPDHAGALRAEDAGKLMALAAYGEPGAPDAQEDRIIAWILSRTDSMLTHICKGDLRDSGYYNIGLTHPSFCRLARRFSDALFARFYDFARAHLKPGLPLVIGGGCGLNCDWNTQWARSGLFSDVFVPPCVNDTGAAIGTAIDAQHAMTGATKIKWNVYAGQDFVMDVPLSSLPARVSAFDPDCVAADLKNGDVIALAQGRCEMGPRALGNRSLLAAPFSSAMTQRLNHIKQRESFRPIAPVVDESLCGQYFDWNGPSPYMLHFCHVRDPRLGAITHVDGSARPQTVTAEQNRRLHRILDSFRQTADVAVLCNTSLNFKGYGFINRLSDLARYCESNAIRRAVVEDQYIQFDNF